MKLFNYTTLEVSLNSDYKSMTVAIAEQYQFLTHEMLYELETLSAWLTNHLEINSVVLTSEAEHFLQGFDPVELQTFDTPKFQKFLRRTQKLIQSFAYLPQTIIADLKRGAKGIGIELALTADIRIIHTEGTIQFNHLQQGLAPSSGGIGLGSLLIPSHHLRNWIMSGLPIPAQQLVQSGFVMNEYSSTHLLLTLLESIAQQAPIQRIQAKRTFLESIRQQISLAMEQDQNYAQSGLITMDWKAVTEQRDFMHAQEFAHFLKQQQEQDDMQQAL